MMNIDTDIVKRNTVEQIVEMYRATTREVKAAYKLLHRAKIRQQQVYEYAQLAPRSQCRNQYYSDYDESALETVLKEVKREVWQGIVNRLNVRNVMDSERRKQLDEQLKTGDGLPEIEVDAIMDVLQGMVSNFGSYMQAAVQEAFQVMLRKSERYKSTGQAFEIADKVVLTWIVERTWNGAGFRTRWQNASDCLTTIENAFRILDGQGPAQQHASDLEAAINATTDGTGETPYFRFRAHKNSNLHLWFKRPDLVKRLNEVAGGAPVLNKAS